MAGALKKAGIELSAKGTAEFKRDLSGISQAIKISRLEMDKNIAILGEGATKTQAYVAKVKQMSSTLEISKNKVIKFKDRQVELKQALSEIPKKIESANDKLKESEALYKRNSEEIKKQKRVVQHLAIEHSKTSAEYKKASSELKELEKANKTVKDTIKNHKDAINDLKVVEVQWQKELSHTSEDILKAETNVYKLRNEIDKLHQEFRTNGGWLADKVQGFQEFGGKLQTVGEKFEKVGGALTKGVTLPLAGALTYVSKSAIEFEDAFTGVVKTVDAPAEVLEKLRQRFIDISKEIPISAKELANIGETAGQLGIQTENIEQFVKTVALLGQTTNLSSDQAATEFARFMNVMGTAQTDVDRLGSTIVALGNNFATTESEISAMAQRLSGASKLVGMSEADTLALATAMSSVGIEAEAGGSAMSAIMKKMYDASMATKNYHEELETASRTMSKTDFKEFKKDLDKNARAMQTLAETSGVSVEEFAKILAEKPVEALNLFIKGMANAKGEGENLNSLLKDIGVKGIRESGTMLKLAGATELTGKTIKIANEAWQENNALQKEAKTRFETTSSKMQVFKNKIEAQAISIGNKLLPKIVNLIDKSQPLIDLVGRLIDGFANLDTKTQLFILGLGPALSLFGKITKGLGNVSNGIGNMLKLFGKITTPKALPEINDALGKFPGLASLAGQAVGLLSNPWVLGIGAIAAAVVGVGAVIHHEMTKDDVNHRKSVEATQGKYQEWFDAVTAGAKKTAESQKEIQGSVKETGKTYEQMVTELKKQNTEIQKSIKDAWEAQTGDYDELKGEFENINDSLSLKLQRLGIKDDELAQIKATWENYGTMLASQQENLNKMFIERQTVTSDMVNSTLIANKTVADSIIETYAKEKEANIQRLEAQKQNLEQSVTNSEYRQREIQKIEEGIGKINRSFQQKETIIRDSESRINMIMSTASAKNRSLTAEEMVAIIQEYKHLETEAGDSMSNIAGAQELLGNALSGLTSTTNLNMLEQLHAIDSATKQKIQNFTEEKDKINAIKEAIINYNNTKTQDKKIEIDISEEYKLNRIKNGIENIPNRTVTIGIRQDFYAGNVPTLNALGNHITPFASGGNVQPRKVGMQNFMGIVGEAGPELFQFSRRGVHITPLSTREKMRGVQGVLDEHSNKSNTQNSINITINNPIVKEDFNIKQMTEQIGKELIATLNSRSNMIRGVYM